MSDTRTTSNPREEARRYVTESVDRVADILTLLAAIEVLRRGDKTIAPLLEVAKNKLSVVSGALGSADFFLTPIFDGATLEQPSE